MKDGREPRRERERLAPVASELPSGRLLDLDKPEVHPRGEETELDDDVWVLGDEQGEGVRDEEVDPRETLHAGFERAGEELDLVLRDELGEGNEEAALKGGETVDGGTVAVEIQKGGCQ